MFQLGFSFIGERFGRLIPGRAKSPRSPLTSSLAWKHDITVHLVRRPRARRYLLRLLPDGTARLVIPRRGHRAEALAFLERSEAWLLRRVEQWRARPPAQLVWAEGARFLFRGEETALRVEGQGARVQLRFSDQVVEASVADDYRNAVHAHLRRLAERELPPRTRELAQQHGISIQRITVRAQRTRWGSCSARGTISLNWRLIQAPESVRDYLIVHELMHRRQMNHSARYWKLVAEAFPDYRAAEQWLKRTRLETMG